MFTESPKPIRIWFGKEAPTFFGAQLTKKIVETMKNPISRSIQFDNLLISFANVKLIHPQYEDHVGMASYQNEIEADEIRT